MNTLYKINSLPDSYIHCLNIPRNTFNDYKKASYYIPIGVTCTWKCKECFNKHWDNTTPIPINIKHILKRYYVNHLLDSVVLAGLEPFDNFEQLKLFIRMFRGFFEDDVVVYTGYYLGEIHEKVHQLKGYNVLVKFGRYIPNISPIFDEKLGVNLASNNQYSRFF